MERLPYWRLLRVLRLLWPYLLLWLIAATAVGGYAAHKSQSARDRELAAGHVEAENLARALAAHVARSLEGVDRTLGLIKFVHESGTGPASLESFRSALNTPNSSEIERRVTRFDRNGQFVDSTDPDPSRRSLSIAERPWFNAVRKVPDSGILVGNAVLGRVSGLVFIPVVRRLDTPGGEFDGVLVAGLDPARLVHLFRTIRVGESSSVGLTDREGQVQVWSTSANPLPESTTAGNVPRSADTVIGDGKMTLREVVDPDGVVALAGIPGTDLVAFAEFSQERLLAGHRIYSQSIVGLALLTLLVLAVPIALVARTSLREVERRGRLEVDFAIERQSARTDPLTHAANRREFDDRLALCHAKLVNSGRPFVLALIDVDHFKQLNDSLGHAIGDRALQRIAGTLIGGVRGSDLVARLGSDEFAVLMSGVDRSGMYRPFEAMLTALRVSFVAERWPISLSVGVIAFEGPVARPRDACTLTDHLMYEVKAAGRNGIRFAVYRDHRLDVERASAPETA